MNNNDSFNPDMGDYQTAEAFYMLNGKINLKYNDDKSWVAYNKSTAIDNYFYNISAFNLWPEVSDENY